MIIQKINLFIQSQRLFMGAEVPNVLLSGDHSKIDQWKKDNRF